MAEPIADRVMQRIGVSAESCQRITTLAVPAGAGQKASLRRLTARPAEMKKRFEKYLAGLTRGKEPGKVRIVME